MTGIYEQIKSATSKSQIDNLLASGAKYLNASDDTRRKWQRAAELRIAFLTKKSEKKS